MEGAAVLFLLVALPFASLGVGTAGAADRHVMNDYLEQVLSTWPVGQDIEVLVRFTSDVTVYDLGHLELAGLEPRHTFHVLPTVWAVGTPDSVYRASLDSRVEWIEWNRPLFYLMENSTYSINATRVWNAVVEDQSLQYPTIDGAGQTVVIVDSGVDAGHPDLDYKSKTIMNLKSDSNLGWYELENSDTSSGHGTHVAGTVAGNGDASAGARRGVAPGARLIALSTGEAVAIINALGALEWVYDNSRPGNNPFNIRCATNSWGTSGAPYDPNDSIAMVTEKLTYENNVVVTFAAGNDGTNDHDGSTITTNPYSNTPAAISVAAYTHDGSGVTSFSSRGLATDNATWPDIGAPGLRINSTRARLTLITAEVCLMGGQCDPYYMAISGTSMATPHVAGEVALLFQAAPSLRVSDYHADFGSAAANASDIDNWFSNPRTRMHEIEVILKLTAHFLSNGTNNDGGDNGVPVYNGTTGLWNLPRDFAQGYGFTDMNAAIALALTLQKLRSTHPEATVLDAYRQWKGGEVFAGDREFEGTTDTLVTGWKGEYTRYNDQFGRPVLVQNSTKLVFIPNGTTEVKVDLSYTAIDVNQQAIGSVSYQIDYLDGSPAVQGPLLGGGGARTVTLSSSQIADKTGTEWAFSVVGVGIRRQDLLPPFQFKELRLPYAYGLTIKLPTTEGSPTVLEFEDTHAMFAQWRFLDNGTTGNGSIIMKRPVFDITNVHWTGNGPPVVGGTGEVPWWAVLVGILIAAGVGLWLLNEQRVKGGKPAIPAVAKAKELVQRVRTGGLKGLRNPSAAPRPEGAGTGSRLKAMARRPAEMLKGVRARLPFHRPG
jgi:subtilisin family serine protease